MSHDRGCPCGREKWDYDECRRADCDRRSQSYPNPHPIPKEVGVQHIRDMGHLAFVNDLALQDAAAVHAKEKTYQGSWKRRGGVGAFMMLARKWDRIETIVTTRFPVRTILGDELIGGPAKYDIFEHIQHDPSDAGLLDDIRDLRRYLLLVEAEMVNQGTVSRADKTTSSFSTGVENPRGFDPEDDAAPITQT